MGDYARVTLLAWPYPGRYELPRTVVEELETHDALPYRDQPIAEDYLGDAGAVVLEATSAAVRSWPSSTSGLGTASPPTAA